MRLLAVLLFLGVGCATARVVGPPVHVTDDPKISRVVVIEPFFENADWKTEVLRVNAPMGSMMPPPMSRGPTVGVGLGMSTLPTEVTQTVKPVLAQVDSLAAEHRLVLEYVQRMRPSWRVSSTSGLAAQDGTVNVVRIIVGDTETVGTDRPIHSTALAFGIFIWPLLIYQAWPVTETWRVYGNLERYDVDASTVKGRLVRYKTQPDSAFNAAGFTPLKREFGLDVTYEEGLLADENPRKGVMIDGFAERLASAIVAIVEEQAP